jgi:hypothetical protein
MSGNDVVSGERLHPNTLSSSVAAGRAIVVPSADLLAIVRHASPPTSPPDALLPYVIGVVSESGMHDWHLTDDALAFASGDVPRLFWQWRSQWERTWALDSGSSLRRLWSAGHELTAELHRAAWDRLYSQSTVSHATRIFAPSLIDDWSVQLERVRDLIRQRDRVGFGFVDITPGRQRIGLARAWSPQDGAEVLAAAESLVVEMRPDLGLCVHAGNDLVEAVHEVQLIDDRIVVRAPGREIVVDFERGRPLAWLMPGVAAWRMRPVPEVLVWARSFAALDECMRYALSLGVEVWIRARYPFFDDSSERIGT